MSEALEVSFDESSEAARRIQQVFGVEGEDLTKRMQAVAAAAFEEYRVEMSGLRSISTIREQRELRLYLLYKHLWPLGGLSDAQVGELFQMTRSQVSTLIAGTWARFRPELEDRLRDEVKQVLEDGEWQEGNKVIWVELSESLARYMRDVIAQTNAPPIEKLREVSRTYELSRQTVTELCGKLGIPAGSVLPAGSS